VRWARGYVFGVYGEEGPRDEEPEPGLGRAGWCWPGSLSMLVSFRQKRKGDLQINFIEIHPLARGVGCIMAE